MSSSSSSSYIIHRLEWIPCLLLWFLMLFVFYDRPHDNDHELLYKYNYKSFSEANSVSSIEKLIDEHCMADIKALCRGGSNNSKNSMSQHQKEDKESSTASSYHHHHHARCITTATNEKDDITTTTTTTTNASSMESSSYYYDPPFIVLLDSYMKDGMCAMAITDAKALNSRSEQDTMTLVIHYILKEAYNFSRLYFRSQSSQSSVVVNHEELQQYLRVVLGSFVEYFSSPSSYSIYDNLYFYVLNNNNHGLYFQNLWDKSEIKNLLSTIIKDEYENDGYEYNSLLKMDVSHDKFFLDCFLSKVKDFLEENNNENVQQQQQQMTTTTTTTTNVPTQSSLSSSSSSSVVSRASGRGTLTNRKLFASKSNDDEDEIQQQQQQQQLGDDHSCLEYYRTKDSLITKRCSLAISEATIRVKELSPLSCFINNIQGIYTWLSLFAFVVMVVLVMLRIRTSRTMSTTTTTKAVVVRERATLRQFRQFLACHVIISILLILYVYWSHYYYFIGSSTTMPPTGSLTGSFTSFLSMALLSLSILIGTYTLPGSIYFCNQNINDEDCDGYFYPTQQPQQNGSSSSLTIKFVVACELPLINESSSIDEKGNTV